MAVNQRQVVKYMKLREQGNTQEVAAAKVGISERTGRRIEQRKNQPKSGNPRNWRTRADPFAAVWDSEIAPKLSSQPDLLAISLLEDLQAKHPEQYPDSLLRTLQRRVKAWRAIHGPDKEIMFAQKHEPGQLGLSDFTQLKNVQITIAGAPLAHLLYHFRMAYGRYSYMQVVLGGESFSALASGLSEALLRLGGAPREHRTDSLAAAFKNRAEQDKDDLTERYEQLCQLYQMQPTRNNKGCCHENGSVEAAHGHLKQRIEQALKLRGSCDFNSVAHYQDFIDEQVKKHNQRNRKLIDQESAFLKPLPSSQVADYDLLSVRVTSTSTISVRKVTYSVPSRLIGERLRVHCYDRWLDCYVGSQKVIRLDRVHVRKGQPRAVSIDYRHMIGALQRKPMAFYNAQLRDHILPNEQWRTLWAKVCAVLAPRQACYLIVYALQVAAQKDELERVANAVNYLLRQAEPPSPLKLARHFNLPFNEPPQQSVSQHELGGYDKLIGLVASGGGDE